ncbi:uncharacterized protein LOC134290144 [Aedes albopictus]|uniref:Reverse transcriptase domain-containing protein n=1 Tax=Aedes albopictus TaxID=7160 RepID=A0ABM2A7A3_AEDAL
MVENSTARVYVTTKEKEMEKIERLKRRTVELSYDASWVENTTDTPLPDYLERTLMLGPNYNVPNREKFPYIETVAAIDKAIKYKDNVDEIRADVATAMSNFLNYNNQPRHHEHEWIVKDVGRSRKFLKENPSLLVTKSDKGNQTVILSANEYEEKMEEMLQDTDTYEKISFDPTARVSRKIKAILDDWKENRYIDARTHRKLNVSNCNPPRIYGLPKTHKPGRPLRPVVSTVGSATYQIAQYLSSILGKIVGKTENHVVNSFIFAAEVPGAQISEDEVMFSLDVTSLYTNVPVDYAIECINRRWNEVAAHTPIDQNSFVAAVKLVLGSTFFVHRGVFYKQNFGVPMGSPLSPVVANLVMERLEQESICKLEEKQTPMKIYRRYVDDCFCVAKRNYIDTIVATFNEFHEKLKFTVENEEDNKLKFLDMTLQRRDGVIVKIWTPKQTNERYLDYNSESPFQHKRRHQPVSRSHRGHRTKVTPYNQAGDIHPTNHHHTLVIILAWPNNLPLIMSNLVRVSVGRFQSDKTRRSETHHEPGATRRRRRPQFQIRVLQINGRIYSLRPPPQISALSSSVVAVVAVGRDSHFESIDIHSSST